MKNLLIMASKGIKTKHKSRCDMCGDKVKLFHRNKIHIYTKFGNDKIRKQKAYWLLCDECIELTRQAVEKEQREREIFFEAKW